MDATTPGQFVRIISAAFVVCVGILVVLVLTLHSRDPLPYQNASLPIEQRVDDLLARMTLEEKIGQMALVDKNYVERISHVRRYGLGGILSGAGAKPAENTARGWREMVGHHIQASRQTRLGIPILYGVDANHGHGNVPGATLFPHFIGLGASRDEKLVEAIGAVVATEAEALETRWVYSPTLDLPRDVRWGRVYETFGDDPKLVGTLSTAFVRGLQGSSTSPRIAASAKHYLGAGDMVWGTSANSQYQIDQGVTPESERALRQEYLPPYKQVVDAGVLSVMIGLNQWGDEKLSASHYLVTDVLKGELGFKGIAVSDWYGVYEISHDKYIASVTGINAGIDMVMLPFEYKIFITDVKRAVTEGDIAPSRIDDAVRRILRVKFALGLFDSPREQSFDVVGAPEHRALAREAVAKSLVLLKDNLVLPLSLDLKKIRIAGSAADNVGMQAGAWTVEWQGVDGNWLPGGVSILDGIRDAAGSTQIEYDKDGNFSSKEKADVSIAIVGERPYSEGFGDSHDPRLTKEDLAIIERMNAASEKLVVIIISGRPLIITDEIDSWDTLIAAWLPGSEGAGVADVLFGKKKFTGTLPLPWPRSVSQLPLNANAVGADGTTPLFPRGFGL